MPIYNNKTYTKLMRPLPAYVERDIYDIPVIQPQPIDISAINNGMWLVNMKNMSVKDKHPSKKIVHSFCYDDVLERTYNDMFKYMARAAPYYAISSFDFSMDPNMDFVQVLNATYKNRWSGAYMQTHGKIAIPTVGWVGSDRYDVTFAGLRDGGVFIISTLGANNALSYECFIQGYREMRRRFPNTTIICVGDKVKGMDDDVCYVLYEESFGTWDRYQNYWQPSFVNWDGTIPEGVLKCHQEAQEQKMVM